MKKKIIKVVTIMLIGFIMLTALLALYIFHIPKVKGVTVRKADEFRVMSYNLKYASSNLGSWPARRMLIAEQINAYKPDSIGIQEGDYLWMDEKEGLPSLLTDYVYVGVGRDDGHREGEFAAIFYRKDKFEVVDSGNFWISSTPDTPSKSWDSVCNRICTWVTLRHKETKKIYTHFNTHLDHVGVKARTEGVRMLLERMHEQEGVVLLSGDFNFLEGSENYKRMIEDDHVSDSKYLAEDSMSYGSINWFLPINTRLIPPIDFFFVKDEGIDVKRYRVDNSYWYDGLPVSDHYPVIVDFTLTE